MCEENCNSTIIDKDVDEIVQLESQLAKVKMPIEDQRNPELLYNKLSLKQLANRTNFDWLDKIFLPSWNGFNVINHSLSNQTEVIVGDLEYYEKAIKIIDDTPPPFRKNVFEFKKIHHGITNLEERWRTCLNLVNSNLDWALSRLYVDHHFTKKEKQEATNVIDEVQDAFRYLLEHNTWLDETTRNASIGKLNKVTKNVAYPDWLLDNLQLDTYHGLDNRTMVIELLSNKNYLMSYVDFLRLNTEKYVNELEQPIVVDKSWPMPPFIVNAAYEPDQNSISTILSIVTMFNQIILITFIVNCKRSNSGVSIEGSILRCRISG
ncbi:hypothetical protein RDWZM_006164 [Blomia tropicalis]|uniref:Peptidase M13 N-terminal domain-containing protein n=1 Tax=Blomia tropicalis TaxID=40697 RepID=A0A9Q0M9U6_BLOTA|nr:hypothetical protein RDWZM_006164 [Blomia tropicalis]